MDLAGKNQENASIKSRSLLTAFFFASSKMVLVLSGVVPKLKFLKQENFNATPYVSVPDCSTFNQLSFNLFNRSFRLFELHEQKRKHRSSRAKRNFNSTRQHVEYSDDKHRDDNGERINGCRRRAALRRRALRRNQRKSVSRIRPRAAFDVFD
jgi:hypothetical protein